MFNLFRSRAKAVRYVLGGLMLLVAASMVTYLIPGFGSMNSSGDETVAEIGHESVTSREVQLYVQRVMKNRQIPSNLLQVFVPQIVDQMINERAMVYAAHEMGFEVSDSDLSEAIQQIFPQLFQDGKFAGRDAYASVLAEQNLGIQEFERMVRNEILRSRLTALVASGVVVTPDEVEQAFRLKDEKVKLEYLVIAPAKLRGQVKVSPEEVANLYKTNEAAYRLPEKRKFQMLVVDEAKVASSITLPEAELRRAYESEKERFRMPERVHARHILLKTTDKPQNEVPKIQARVEDLLKKIKGGADFADLAKKNSEDPGSAAKGGDLDWITRGQTVKNFEDTAFSLKPKELSGVVKTEYGFHIIQVLDKQAAHVKTFEEVRKDLDTEKKRQLVFDRIQSLADQARAELAKSPRSAEAIARTLNIQFVDVPPVKPGEPIPEVGASKELDDAISAVKQGEVTPVVQVSGNRLVVGVLTDIIPSQPAKLADVEAQIRAGLTESKLRDLVEAKSREAMMKVTASGGDVKKVAQSMGLDFRTSSEFTRVGNVEGLGNAAQLVMAFDKPVGGFFGPVTIQENHVVCKVVAKIPADLSKLALDRDSLAQEIKRNKARERVDLFEDGVRAALIRKGKVKVHQKVIDRIAGSYRG
jgi:peptidyl-prolyl cis-trans isomerase D